MRDAAGGLPVVRARTMEEILAAPARRAAFTTTLLTAFAGIAVLLAVIGPYALMSYSAQQRSREIGIRMALGAVPSDVRNLVLVEGLRLALTGVALGVGAALVLTRLMSSLVFGITTYRSRSLRRRGDPLDRCRTRGGGNHPRASSDAPEPARCVRRT